MCVCIIIIESFTKKKKIVYKEKIKKVSFASKLKLKREENNPRIY